MKAVLHAFLFCCKQSSVDNASPDESSLSQSKQSMSLAKGDRMSDIIVAEDVRVTILNHADHHEARPPFPSTVRLPTITLIPTGNKDPVTLFNSTDKPRKKKRKHSKKQGDEGKKKKKDRGGNPA